MRRSVTNLIPKLAAFSPQRFSESYLSSSAALLLATIRVPSERDAGFNAIGDLAAALAEGDEEAREGETVSHTTPFASCTPFLEDFASPAFPFQRSTGETCR